MRPIIIVLFLIVYSPSILAQNAKNVLFIGNSITYFHDMPQTVQKMVNEKDIKIKIEQSTFPGVSLFNHLMRIEENNTWRRLLDNEVSLTVKKILSQDWDIVILQENPGRLRVKESKEYDFIPSLIKLDSLIKTKNGKTVLFQPFASVDLTYPFRDRCPGALIRMGMALHDNRVSQEIDYYYYSDSFHNSEEEYETMKAACEEGAKLTNAHIVPIGLAFQLCKKKYPDVMLYEAFNDPHPSKNGSFLIACLFYNYITGKKSSDLKYSGDVDAQLAIKLKALADGVM